MFTSRKTITALAILFTFFLISACAFTRQDIEPQGEMLPSSLNTQEIITLSPSLASNTSQPELVSTSMFLPTATPLPPVDCSVFSESNSSETRQINVSGQAEIRVVPDKVSISLGMETWNKNLSEAKKENDEAIRQVIKIAQHYGIDSRYIQTDYVSIQPSYNNRYESSAKTEIDGYTVRKSMVVTLHDLSVFENFLSDVLENNSINRVQNIEFGTTQLREYKDQARTMAIRAAYEKGAAMAGELCQQINQPLSITENRINSWSGYSAWWSANSSMTQNYIQDTAAIQPLEGTFAPGQVIISADVSVSFELK